MASQYSDDASDIYTYRFSGMSGIVKKDMKSTLVVAVSPVSTFDTSDVSGDSWQIGAGTSPAAGNSNFISAASANGRYRDFGTVAASTNSLIDFQKATGEATWKVTSSSTNPVARTVQVSKTADTNEVTLLAFDVKAENSAMLLQKLPVSLTVASASPATTAQTVVKTVKLYVDGKLVTTESAPAGMTSYVLFGKNSKLNLPIAMNATTKVEIRADLASRGVSALYAEGTTVKAEYGIASTITATTAQCSASATPFTWCTGANLGTVPATSSILSVELDNVNRDTVSVFSGSVTGENQTLRTTGALVTMGVPTAVFTPLAATGASANRATFTIPVTVKAFDNTLYVGQTIEAQAAAGAITGTNAFAFAFNNSTAASTGIATPPTGTATTTISSTATVEGSAWRVDAGSEKTFNLQVIVTGASAAANLRVQLNDFKFFTEAVLTTGTVQTLAPSSSFQTSYVQVF